MSASIAARRLGSTPSARCMHAIPETEAVCGASLGPWRFMHSQLSARVARRASLAGGRRCRRDGGRRRPRPGSRAVCYHRGPHARALLLTIVVHHAGPLPSAAPPGSSSELFFFLIRCAIIFVLVVAARADVVAVCLLFCAAFRARL
jgi:hypothetical protein